ncbi:MAG TPA: T9SS type A sorting domain-containing protein, partial [Cryomorphaceae bacterium]|nr:T9SS type A sorting domain-containing protein [Cryomorphaceae bacterium]
DELQTSGAFTNDGATSDGDPNPNDEEANCWFGTPLVEKTVWFTFEGDGNSYFIETLDCGVDNYIPFGDTQMAIFTGECGDFTQVACNEDGPQASEDHYPAGIELLTEEGVTYYVMVDGYEGDAGEFCIGMTNHGSVGVNDASAFSFTAYPNPTRGALTIESAEPIEALTLINVLGQRVEGWSFAPTQTMEIDTHGLPSGIYFLEARSGSDLSVHKIVVE